MLREDLEEVKHQAEELKQEHSLAWELTRTLKKELKHKNIIIVILIILLFLSNICWLVYENSFETSMDSQEVYYSTDSEITQTIN